MNNDIIIFINVNTDSRRISWVLPRILDGCIKYSNIDSPHSAVPVESLPEYYIHLIVCIGVKPCVKIVQPPCSYMLFGYRLTGIRKKNIKRGLHDAILLATSKLVHYLILKKHCLIECASKLTNYFDGKLVCE